MLRANSRWSFAPPAPVTQVAVASGEGGAVIADEARTVTCLDALGRAAWSWQPEDPIRTVGITDEGRGAFVLTTHRVTRLSAAGKVVWEADPPPMPVGMSVRRDGAVIAVSGAEGMVRLFAPTGKELRTRRLFHPSDLLAPQMTSMAVTVASRRGDVSILDPQGQAAWHTNIACDAWSLDASRERIAVASHDGVYAFAPDGTPAGIYDVEAPTIRAIFGHRGATLLVQDTRRRLLLVEVASGNTLWHVDLNDDARDLAFSWDGGSILVASRNGDVELLSLMDDDAPQARTQPTTGAFLEVDAGGAPKVEPRPRWRARIPPVAAAQIAVLSHGAGVALLDREEGVLSLWTGGATPAWTAPGLGPGTMLGAAQVGNPIVVAGERGVQFFTIDGGRVGGAEVEATRLAVAESGLAILVGSRVARLHLFDAVGRPMWDAPTAGFSTVGLSPRGREIAIARADGTVSFHVRGSGGWTADLTPGPGGASPDLEAPRVGFRTLPDFSAADGDLEILVTNDGLVYGTRGGKAGFVDGAGRRQFEEALPGARRVDKIVRAGDGALLRDAAGAWVWLRREDGRWSLSALGGGRLPGRGEDSLFAVMPGGDSVERLLEFRYDSKEIGCYDAVSGSVMWRRALDQAPNAVAVTADGSCLAALVAGELVLYDLSAGTPAASQAPQGPRFLEL